MLRAVLLIGAGLAAGFAAAYWLAGSSPAAEPKTRLVESTPPAPSELPSRIVELERQLGAEIDKRTALEERERKPLEPIDSHGPSAYRSTRRWRGVGGIEPARAA